VVSEENGFCFLYPEGFDLGDQPNQAPDLVHILGPILDPDAMESIRVFMTVDYNGPADGLDSAAYATRWEELYLAEADDPARETRTIDGQEAVILRGLPGFAPVRGAYIVANGYKYRITLSPQPEDVPELEEPAQRVWNTVVESIHFFPPIGELEHVRPEDVCPEESEDREAFVSFTDGYCFLYPDDFMLDPDLPGRVTGGPVLDVIDPWGEIRPSLTLGTFGRFSDAESPRDILEPRMEFIDLASVLDTTIGGYPAVVFRDPRGPWASRQAMILVDGFVYTIVAQPLEPEVYPEGMPPLDRLWNTVTMSLAFFDKWE
jgi:hypothetical protein